MNAKGISKILFLFFKMLMASTSRVNALNEIKGKFRIHSSQLISIFPEQYHLNVSLERKSYLGEETVTSIVMSLISLHGNLTLHIILELTVTLPWVL